MNLELERAFSDCFAHSWHTELLGGAEEPLYQPAVQGRQFNRIFYRSDYASSALHEVAHWCIAGDERRKCVDYGYWYAPDGRDAVAQQQFESVEVAPQALEWHFSIACGISFRVSADNLSAPAGAADDFRERVAARAARWLKQGLPQRAELFCGALQRRFAAGRAARCADFV